MEIDEVAARLVRHRWKLLLIAVIVPALGVAIWVWRQPATYTAHARLAMSADVPKSASEAASLASQVQAIATSEDVVRDALRDAGLRRDVGNLAANDITVTGLGPSAVVDLAVTDGSADSARRIAQALSSQVVTAFDTARIGNLPDVIKSIDAQLTALGERRAPIAAQAAAKPQDPLVASRLAGIDRLISDLSGDRNRLSEEQAAAGHAEVVSAAQTPQQPDPTGMTQKVGLAAVLGMVLGLLIAAIIETFRPTVPGAGRLGRVLGAPLLGRIAANPTTLASLGRRIRLAARRTEVSTVVLARTGGLAVGASTVDRVASAVLPPLSGLDNAGGNGHVPINLAEVDGRHSVGLLTSVEHRPLGPDVHRICAIEELEQSAEHGRVGVAILAGSRTRTHDVEAIRDLLAATGWPLLGVIDDHARGGRA